MVRDADVRLRREKELGAWEYSCDQLRSFLSLDVEQQHRDCRCRTRGHVEHCAEQMLSHRCCCGKTAASSERKVRSHQANQSLNFPSNLSPHTHPETHLQLSPTADVHPFPGLSHCLSTRTHAACDPPSFKRPPVILSPYKSRVSGTKASTRSLTPRPHEPPVAALTS